MSTDRWVVVVQDHPFIFGYSAMAEDEAARYPGSVEVAFVCRSKRSALLWFRRLNDMIAGEP